MNNVNIMAMLANTQSGKTDFIGTKASDRVVASQKNSFNNQLNKVKNKAEVSDNSSTKKSSEEIATERNNNPKTQNEEKLLGKDIPIKKAIDIKEASTSEETDTTIEGAILALLSEVLQIPIEAITETLENMACEPTDLFDQSTFTSFLSQVYPQMSEEQLLFEGQNLKDVSKLFVQLQEMSSTLEGKEIQIITEQTIVSDEVVETEVQTVVVTPQEALIEPIEGLQQTISESAGIAEQLLGAKDKGDKTSTAETTLASMMSNENQDIGMGLTMPIQSFSTTVKNQLWTAEGVTTPTPKAVSETMITHQIIDKMDIATLGTQKEINMQLSPRELGELSIKIVETNGVLTADISVQNEKTKAFILNEVNILKEALLSAGLSIGEVKVDIKQSQGQSQMDKQKQKSSKRIQEIIQKHLNDVSDEEAIEEASIEMSGETEVDYMV